MKTIFKHRGDFTWRDSVRLGGRESKPSVVLRPEALERLHRRRARRGDPARARAPLRLERLRRQARRLRDPRAPALYAAAAHEVAGRLHGRAAAHGSGAGSTRPPGRGSTDGRTAALLPAERRGLGRHALARHRDMARTLVDRAVRAAAVRARPGKAAQPYDAAKLARRRARVLAPSNT